MIRSFGPATWAVALAAVALTGRPAAAQEPPLYAGIEIGAKGVKATVVRIDRGSKTNPVTVPFAKTSNTTIGNFDAGRFRPEAVTETVDAVAGFIAAIEKEFKLASEVVVVGSSGVAMAANKDELVAAVEKRTGKTLKYITPEEEAELLLTGLALRGERDDVVLLDIGSGNSKGGAFVDAKFVPFSVPLGTVTYTNRVKAAAAGKPFAEVAAGLADAELVKPAADQLTKAQGLDGRKLVYATGGIVWAVATFTHPELSEQALVPLTAADVDGFLKLLAGGEFPDLNTDAVTSESAKKAAVTDMKRIRDAFTPEQLTAGATVLKSLFTALNVEKKQAYFARNGLTAWLVAYVTPKDARVVASGPKPTQPPTETKKTETPVVVPTPKPDEPKKTEVAKKPDESKQPVTPESIKPVPVPVAGGGVVTGTVVGMAPRLAPPLYPSYPAYPSYFAPGTVIVGTPVYHSAGVVYSSGPCGCGTPVYGPTVYHYYAPQPAPRRLLHWR